MKNAVTPLLLFVVLLLGVLIGMHLEQRTASAMTPDFAGRYFVQSASTTVCWVTDTHTGRTWNVSLQETRGNRGWSPPSR